ncbi:MAG: ABC transporter substrate-binding protein [Limnochordia bacterium]|nr:ABC transporter substrate-binding protein [Limnochordia bacterium]
MSNRKLTISVLVTILLLAMAFGVSAQEKRMATWVDEVIIVEEPSATNAVARLQAGDIDIYSTTSSEPVPFATILGDPNLDYYQTFGSYSEITWNPVGPTFEDGRFNPFSVRRIREATNWLIDRDYIAQELYGGLALPKATMLNNAYVDYSRVVETARALEFQYAYDFELAKQVITEEMMAAGATLVNEKWHYNGQPIEVLILARSEDQRASVGDYLADQLEAVGLTATVDYRSGAEASPIWMMGDPWQGQWHAYTGGWGAGAVYRDQGHIFDQMYTRRTMSQPLWQALEPIPELDETSEMLYYKRFSTLEERNALYSKALTLAFQDSPRIYTVDQISYLARRSDVSASSDLAGGLSSNPLWASTIRRGDEIGGTVTVGSQQVLVEPWNPIGGSNWTFDQLPMRATFDRGFVSNPFTGNYMPHRIEKIEVTVQEGLPVSKEPASDWVTLEFAPEITVPGDAWLYWDPTVQRYITVDEVYPEGLTAPRHTVIHYREDLFDTVTWHDGSPYTIGDMMLSSVLSWDRGFEASPFFDPAEEASTKTAMNNARGWRIISEDPFVYEVWSQSWYIDAEQNLGDIFAVYYNYGTAPWHTLVLGMLAEQNGELAFTASKANTLEAEWLGYNMGPSLPILDKWLDHAIETNYLPYESFLSQWISEEEIASRYANAKAWYEDKGHFWIGNGPMYLEKTFPTERQVLLRRYENYSEPADKWAMFDEPRIAEAELTGGTRVRAGGNISFEVEVTFKGEAYPTEFIQEVKYIVLDATGSVAYSGYATAVEGVDGLFEIALTGEETSQLPIGSNTIEAIVLPTLVASATFSAHTFVTLP